MLKSFVIVIVMAVISALVGLAIGTVTNTSYLTGLYAPVIFVVIYGLTVVLPKQRWRRSLKQTDVREIVSREIPNTITMPSGKLCSNCGTPMNDGETDGVWSYNVCQRCDIRDIRP